MQIVIDMDESYYELVKHDVEHGNDFLPYKLLANGTPLPKGHGDLADKKEIIERYKRDCGRRIYADEFIHDIEVNVPTLIEADEVEK